MKANKSLIRKSHFLGTKIRNLRKRNNLTMDDLSTRCVRIDPEYAPSVSYLSMIERGKRVPSVEMLTVIADVFQKDVDWFLDDVAAEKDMITPNKGNRGGISGMPLEPSFLFSNDILQIAIPELLNQTGTSGREFAHLLIRAHQEHHQNHFPDLERAAEEVGLKRMPLSVEELLLIVKQQGINVKWFDETPAEIVDELGVTTKNVTSSFFEAPNVLHLNRCLKNFPRRLKYELAVYIGRSILHSGNHSLSSIGGAQAGGLSSTGINVGGVKYEELQRQNNKAQGTNSAVNAQDILNAWQDFESSFFAGALLCPKVPFRQLLDRHGYEVSVAAAADVSESVAMRRMTAVSPYSHWHYFDAYTPGKLKAVYRGNGIPLPWGNMRQVDDPCHHWAVFQMFDKTDLEIEGTSSQLSIMNVNGESRIYCCESKKVHDLAGNPHVICAGIDLNPALQAQGRDASAIAAELQAICADNGGEVPMTRNLTRNMTRNATKGQVNEPIFTTQTTPKKLSTDDISALRNIKKDLISVAKVLNINWVERSLERSAKLICSRGNVCPRKPGCYE